MTGLQTAFNASTEEVVIRLLIQLSVILVAARLVGGLFARFGQSQSVGEIWAGVLLGPSGFGWLLPGAFRVVFPAEGPQLIPYFSHLGLVLTLFLIGMEFDYGNVPKHRRQVFGIALATLLVPFVSGIGLSVWLWKLVPGDTTFPAYALFIGLTMAITAIPIMGRILVELKLTKTRVGVLGITAGALKDLCTWFVLAVVIAIARPPVRVAKLATMVPLTLMLVAVVLTLGRRALARAERAFPLVDGKPHPNLLAGLLVTLLLLSAATSRLGIFAIFGAFLAGAAISHRRALANAVSDRLHDLVIVFFLPIFFAYTGLQADMTRLSSTLWMWVAVVTAVGSLANAAPAYLLARRGGMDRRESGAMAVLMNTPGLMELIVLNVGLNLSVIPPQLFSVLVASALLKNLLTTPVLRRLAARGLPLAASGDAGLSLQGSEARAAAEPGAAVSSPPLAISTVTRVDRTISRSVPETGGHA